MRVLCVLYVSVCFVYALLSCFFLFCFLSAFCDFCVFRLLSVELCACVCCEYLQAPFIAYAFRVHIVHFKSMSVMCVAFVSVVSLYFVSIILAGVLCVTSYV